MLMTPSNFVPRRDSRTKPPETNAFVRKPPSKRVSFPPRRGWFEAPTGLIDWTAVVGNEDDQRAVIHALFSLRLRLLRLLQHPCKESWQHAVVDSGNQSDGHLPL